MSHWNAYSGPSHSVPNNMSNEQKTSLQSSADTFNSLVHERNKLCDECAKLREALERERMRHAACGVIALSNTRESLDKAKDMKPEYLSASVADCIKAAEREIKLREALLEIKAAGYTLYEQDGTNVIEEALS